MNQVSFNKVRLSLAVLLCLCATSLSIHSGKYGQLLRSCERKFIPDLWARTAYAAFRYPHALRKQLSYHQ